MLWAPPVYQAPTVYQAPREVQCIKSCQRNSPCPLVYKHLMKLDMETGNCRYRMLGNNMTGKNYLSGKVSVELCRNFSGEVSNEECFTQWT